MVKHLSRSWIVGLFSLLIGFGPIFFGSYSQAAALRAQELQELVSAKFLKEANDGTTKLGQRLLQLNQETQDGRNPRGTIDLPVQKDQLQVVMVDGEDIYAPWHYASKLNGYCVASANSAKILIYLQTVQNVHFATGYSTLLFASEATSVLKAKILKDSKDTFCEDQLGEKGGNNNFGPVQRDFKIANFKEIQIPIK